MLNKSKSSIKKIKNKSVIVDALGIAHIKSTFNNIIITLTNKIGDVIAWSSAGKMNFKGSKKNTPYAAQIAAENVAKKGLNAGIKKVEVKVNGPGAGRDAAIRALSNSGIIITLIQDITPLPHNGCRPPKRRRV
ncbi:30S ribosomal protein S11 [Blattabacterium cuenoti]|uniref:30S ribosomal protein S11 n=1 Tax=Blattabacterium cuenoti TaxID=1653831 RepID=UPI00163D08C4|nr:30S ribosomal protein S11 [Blattabacterium cuenoti]